MSRLPIPTNDESPAATKPLLAAVQRQLGAVPNLMKVLGHSPAALEGYLALNSALAKGAIDGATRERIALAIAAYNGCAYCLAAHTDLGRTYARLDDAEIAAARAGSSRDRKAASALAFARRVAEQRGHVDDADLAALRASGHDDAAAIEIAVNVALNVLTNYVNSIALTDVDFPLARRHAA